MNEIPNLSAGLISSGPPVRRPAPRQAGLPVDQVESGREYPELQQAIQALPADRPDRASLVALAEAATRQVLSRGASPVLGVALAQVGAEAVKWVSSSRRRGELAQHYLRQIESLTPGTEQAAQASNVLTLAQFDEGTFVAGLGFIADPGPPLEGAGTNFYQAVASRSPDLGAQRDALDELPYEFGQALLQKALSSECPAPGTDNQLISDFYRSVVDVEARNRAGIAPLAPWLEKAENLETPSELANLLGEVHAAGLPLVFITRGGRVGSGITYLSPDRGGLLEDRASILEEGPRSRATAYATALLEAAGDRPPELQARVERAIKFEQQLASTLEDDGKIRFSDDFQADGMDWRAFRDAVPTRPGSSLYLHQQPFFERFSSLAASDPEGLRDYLRVSLLHLAAPYLTEQLEQLHSDYSGSGLPTPEWATMEALGPITNRHLVQAMMQPEDEVRLRGLFEEVRKAYSQHLVESTWLSTDEKLLALRKLDSITLELGGPTQEADLSQARVAPDRYFGNVVAVGREKVLYRARTPSTVWDRVTQDDSVVFEPDAGAVVIPASALGPPLYDRTSKLDLYSRMGTVMGHEITHALIGYGDGQRDVRGKPLSIWPQHVQQELDRRRDSLARQAGLELDSPMPEELACDLMGIAVGYRAFKNSGLQASDRDFFVSQTRNWAGVEADEGHPSGQLRVNPALKNLPVFAAAFGLAPGMGMVLTETERISIF